MSRTGPVTWFHEDGPTGSHVGRVGLVVVFDITHQGGVRPWTVTTRLPGLALAHPHWVHIRTAQIYAEKALERWLRILANPPPTEPSWTADSPGWTERPEFRP